MKKIIIKHFAFDYYTKAFGYAVNFKRPATIIFPLMVLNGIFVAKYGFGYHQIIPMIPLIIALYFGFLHFYFFPLKWEELDKEQLFQFHRLISEEEKNMPSIYYDKVAQARKYMVDNIENKEHYKPLRMVFHPAIMFTLSVVIAWVVL